MVEEDGYWDPGELSAATSAVEVPLEHQSMQPVAIIDPRPAAAAATLDVSVVAASACAPQPGKYFTYCSPKNQTLVPTAPPRAAACAQNPAVFRRPGSCARASPRYPGHAPVMWCSTSSDV